jgi:LysR family transcriptional regulator, transcriptional activator of the cysJI operon
MRLEARLRAFTAFVRRRSFSGAAQELRVSQPAISRHIAALERDVRAVLVDRRSGGLTAAGDLLANHALRAEAILAQTTNLIGALREPEKGWLSIRAAGISGTYLVPDVVAEFQHRHPQVRVSFLLGTSAEVVETVRTHQAEIGVAGGLIAAPEIEAEPLLEDEIVIVGPARLKDRRLSRDDLEALTWISREEGSATRVVANSALAELGIVPARRLALPAWESIKLAVRRGQGIAAFSRLVVAEELEAGTLAVIPFVPWTVRRMISIIRIRDASLTPAAQQFVDMLHAHCRKKRAPFRPRSRTRRRRTS